MSPLTPYSPGLPVFQPGGGAWAREVGKGPLMSTSKSSKAKSGLMVSIVILFTPPLPITHDAQTSSSVGMLHKWIRCSGPLCVQLGVMGKKKATSTKALIYCTGLPRDTATGTLVLSGCWKLTFSDDSDKTDGIISKTKIWISLYLRLHVISVGPCVAEVKSSGTLV